ncbi:hypothetical protein [Streptomyces naphthomycinicus]|uniref:hypothetical protein n=1 Tax=Streptomyces naphthomycinicus TaxID=2872625 RepID=UPI001CEDE0F7|nr:hypothetical protein [Streptomyces sp. TML10]
MEGKIELLWRGATVASCLIALAALRFSQQASRKQHQITRFGIARDLHAVLINDSARKARHRLGCLHWQNKSISGEGEERSEVMSAYFAMLWAFEHVASGRELLLKDSGNEPDAAVLFLDRMITVHVLEYICTFHEIKKKLTESDTSDEVFDGAYTESFVALREALRETADDPTRRKLENHTNNSESCRCACHRVTPRPADPPRYGAAA